MIESEEEIFHQLLSWTASRSDHDTNICSTAVWLFVLSHLVPSYQGHALHQPCHATSPGIPASVPCNANDGLHS